MMSIEYKSLITTIKTNLFLFMLVDLEKFEYFLIQMRSRSLERVLCLTTTTAYTRTKPCPLLLGLTKTEHIWHIIFPSILNIGLGVMKYVPFDYGY